LKKAPGCWQTSGRQRPQQRRIGSRLADERCRLVAHVSSVAHVPSLAIAKLNIIKRAIQDTLPRLDG
jgi:hypothetical protein